MFTSSAEHFYIRKIRLPCIKSKVAYLKKFEKRHDFDMVKIAKLREREAKALKVLSFFGQSIENSLGGSKHKDNNHSEQDTIE